jgi:hypothetical protein
MRSSQSSSPNKQRPARLHWLPKTRWVTGALRTRKQRLLAAASLVAVGALVAVGLLAQGILVHASSARNNEGLSLDTNTTVGNFDGAGNSYSQTALAATFPSGGTVTVQGLTEAHTSECRRSCH